MPAERNEHEASNRLEPAYSSLTRWLHKTYNKILCAQFTCCSARRAASLSNSLFLLASAAASAAAFLCASSAALASACSLAFSD